MTVTELKQKIVRQLDQMEFKQLAFVASLLDSLNVYLGSKDMTELEQETSYFPKQKFVNDLRGMAADSTLSSDDFAKRKQSEIDWENRNR